MSKPSFSITCAKIARVVAMSVFVTALVGALSRSAHAQRSVNDTIRNTMIELAVSAEVQLELETNEEQMELVFALRMDVLTELRGVRAARQKEAARGGSEQPVTDAERRDTTRRVDDATMKLLSTVLTTRQYQRLQQLRLQKEGVWAFERKEFRLQLGLSPEQSAEIAKAFEPDDVNESTRELHVTEVLEDQQMAKWETLKGKPFRLPRGRRGRGE